MTALFNGNNHSLAGPENIIAFVLNEREVTVGEVIRAAHFRGEALAPWHDLLAKLACGDHASAREFEPDFEALQARADQFRYDRGLITTENTVRWLELRALTEDDFSAYLVQCYWKDKLGKEIAPRDEDIFTAGPERSSQLAVELLLSGVFDRMSRDLRWRLAALSFQDAASSDFGRRIVAERALFFERIGLKQGGLDSWLEAVSGDKAWFEEMLALEAAYTERREAILTPEQVTRLLGSRRLDLIRFEVEKTGFNTPGAAFKAVSRGQEIRVSTEEKATASGDPGTKPDFLAEDIPEDLQIFLLSTPDDGLVSPPGDQSLVCLFRVQCKVEATATDKAIRPQVEDFLLKESFDELCAGLGLKSSLALQ
jgi:hypothetical protein